MGATPAGAFALPITADRPEITGAAFGDLANATYAVHLVNRGNRRPVVLTGLPESLTSLQRFTTDARRGMEEGEVVRVQRGQADLVLAPASYTTLLGAGRTSATDASGETAQTR